MGVVRMDGAHVSFELFNPNNNVCVIRYEGEFKSGRLWLSCVNLTDNPHYTVSHGKLPYRFHPFNPMAYPW